MVPCGLVIAGIDVARLPLDLPLRCRCGHVRGIASAVSSSTGGRVLCYCKDCQAFARFLERADVLDAAGGTDIFQMPPGRVNLTAGMDAVRCLRLSNRGVYRWYTDCCRTPIGSIAGPRVPLIGVIHCFMDHQADGHSRDPGARPAPLPNLRTLRRRATPADGARAAVVRALRPPRIEDVRLVDARPCSADSVLRR
jgi:hypothetical protein